MTMFRQMTGLDAVKDFRKKTKRKVKGVVSKGKKTIKDVDINSNLPKGILR